MTSSVSTFQVFNSSVGPRIVIKTVGIFTSLLLFRIMKNSWCTGTVSQSGKEPSCPNVCVRYDTWGLVKMHRLGFPSLASFWFPNSLVLEGWGERTEDLLSFSFAFGSLQLVFISCPADHIQELQRKKMNRGSPRLSSSCHFTFTSCGMFQCLINCPVCDEALERAHSSEAALWISWFWRRFF